MQLLAEQPRVAAVAIGVNEREIAVADEFVQLLCALE
jgi:hypothetical protein